MQNFLKEDTHKFMQQKHSEATIQNTLFQQVRDGLSHSTVKGLPETQIATSF